MTIAAIRFNNPGNVSLPIKGWTGGGVVVGIQGQPGYAHFPTPDVGFAAMRQQVRNRIEEGLNTVRKIGMSGVYESPPTWSWVANVARYSGIGVDEVIDPKNVVDMNALLRGICRQETGLQLAQLGVGNTTNVMGEAGGAPRVPGAITPPAASAASPSSLDEAMALLVERKKQAQQAITAAAQAKADVEKEISDLQKQIQTAQESL